MFFTYFPFSSSICRAIEIFLPEPFLFTLSCRRMYLQSLYPCHVYTFSPLTLFALYIHTTPWQNIRCVYIHFPAICISCCFWWPPSASLLTGCDVTNSVPCTADRVKLEISALGNVNCIYVRITRLVERSSLNI